MHLVAEDESLATLSRTLGLKKGHLQFHLNVLAASGLIIYDRKSHLYAITGKGGRALDGLTRLVADLTTE
jgi:DNA-binding IclR family transcriptional regulator